MVDGDNLGLVTTRQTQDEWSALVSDAPIRHKGGSRYDISSLFPLWLTPEPEAGLFAAAEAPAREANLAPGFVAALEAATGLGYAADGAPGDAAFGPQDAFHYVYGVLHAPAYRARYEDFLRSDYPRVPLPSGREAFQRLAEVGRQLVALHLLREVPEPGTRYPVKGSDTVETGFPKYAPPGTPGPDGDAAADGRVFLNAEQFVGGLEPEVWAHEVGGYQVLDKWLKDRRGRTLSYAELTRYTRIVSALRETQRVMARADAAAADAFGW